MAMPRNEFQEEYVAAWRTYLNSLEKALDQLEEDIGEASEMVEICTDEWCQATEHVIDDLSNALFSISEPRWSSPADSDRIKTLKRRVRDLYADYRGASSQARSG